jgi:coenzyme PQQ precursor peptide PqqA
LDRPHRRIIAGRRIFRLLKFIEPTESEKEQRMKVFRSVKWKMPVIIEIAVGLEINAYACAEVN